MGKIWFAARLSALLRDQVSCVPIYETINSHLFELPSAISMLALCYPVLLEFEEKQQVLQCASSAVRAIYRPELDKLIFARFIPRINTRLDNMDLFDPQRPPSATRIRYSGIKPPSLSKGALACYMRRLLEIGIPMLQLLPPYVLLEVAKFVGGHYFPDPTMVKRVIRIFQNVLDFRRKRETNPQHPKIEFEK